MELNQLNKKIHTMAPPPHTKSEPQKKTALQVINEMIKARLTQAEVDVFDDHGVRGEGLSPAGVCLITETRIKVLSVGVSNLRLKPSHR